MDPTTTIVGLFFLLGGVSVLLNPRIQGARDAEIITADEVGSGERLAAYVGGSFLVLLGLGFLILAL